MYKIIHGLFDVKINVFLILAMRIVLKAARLKLLEPLCKKDVLKFSFFPRTARDWNQPLPICLVFRSFEEFSELPSLISLISF